MRTITCALFSFFFFGFIHAGPVCLRCTEVTDIKDCLMTVACGDNEECYLESVIKGDLSVRYNAGCRASRVCSIMSALGKKRRDLVNCEECCTAAPDKSGPCNAKLCGFNTTVPPMTTGTITTSNGATTTTKYHSIQTHIPGSIHAGPVCLRCTEVTDIKDCLTAACGDNEECYLESVTKGDLSVRYNAGCRASRVCSIMSALGKKRRDLVNCAECCTAAPDKSGPCNAKLCGLNTTVPPMTTTTTTTTSSAAITTTKDHSIQTHTPGSIHAGPVCLRCTEVTDIKDCLTAACGDNEECYLESVTKGDLSVRYNAGCRASRVCSIMSALGKKRRDLVICAECCTAAPDKSGPCNAKLCGLNTTVPPMTTTTTTSNAATTTTKDHSIQTHTPGTIHARLSCMQCYDVHDIINCVTLECGHQEECYLERITKADLTIRYNAGCRSSRVCSIITALNAGKKKRDLVNCAECCTGAPDKSGSCNANLCGLNTTAPPMTTKATSATNTVKITTTNDLSTEATTKDHSVQTHKPGIGVILGKKRRDSVTGADCCTEAPNDSGPCNAKLCGLSRSTETITMVRASRR